MSAEAPSLVLVFSKRANPAQAAKLHASTCPVVGKAEANPLGFAVVRDQDSLRAEIKSLHERIYPVRRCPCAKGLVLP